MITNNSNKKQVSNPFDSLYQIEDWVYDNATPEIKEVISDLQSIHYDFYTVDHLEQLTQQLKHSQLQFVKDGILYYEILTKRLYKAKYSNFNQYGQEELGLTSWRIKQKIEATAVVLKLIAAGFTRLPQNTSQAYVLHKLTDERLVEVWHSVCVMYSQHELTREKIELVAYPPEPTKAIDTTSVRLMPSTYEALVLGACKLKLTINDFVALLLQNSEFFTDIGLLLLKLNFST